MLRLGNQTFPVNLIQGPLAGVSCAPFRLLTWRYSQPAFSCTEMISAKTVIHQPKDFFQRYIVKDKQEGPVSFQLSATEANELAEAVKYVTDHGADLVDLNCGCPVNKIRRKGAGSKLLSDPQRLFHLIRAMKQNTHLPVSVKIRVHAQDEMFNHELAQVINDAGADFAVVHGRHWTEHYETPCRYDAIQLFVEKLSIPVVGNGDIACIDSLKKMLATGCAGVMIGRAGVGQPWLIAKLVEEMQGRIFNMPSLPEVAAIFVEHTQRLADMLGSEKFAILQMRKLAKYYARQVIEKRQFSEAVNSCETLKELENICDHYFK